MFPHSTSTSSMPEKLQNQPLHAPKQVSAIDDMLSKELNQLSFADRNALAEEIHGVRSMAPEETPELLAARLLQFQHELDHARLPNKQAYEMACSHHPLSYIHTDEFRLRFLRYQLMDPKAAVKHMLSFLNGAHELFGTAILDRPLQMTDLSKDGMDLMRTGEYQNLPFRDRSGRRIQAFVGNLGLQFPMETRMKVVYYLTWVATEDIETQRKGIVGVVWWPTTAGITPTKRPHLHHPSSSDSEPEESFHIQQEGLSHIPGPMDHIVGSRLFEGNPGRTVAMHICLPDRPVFNFVRSSLVLTLSGTRQRIKVHTGDGLALQYALHSYGLPVDLLPITETGNIKTKNHTRFMKMRGMRERESNSGVVDSLHNVIECPGMHDVVFRVGDSYLCHPGNAKFRGWIESTFEEYDSGDKNRKMEITWTLVDEVLKTGRFLIWDQPWWTVLQDREKMRLKVVGAFKDQKRRLKATSNVQVNQSSTNKFIDQDGRKRKRDEGLSCFSKQYQ